MHIPACRVRLSYTAILLIALVLSALNATSHSSAHAAGGIFSLYLPVAIVSANTGLAATSVEQQVVDLVNQERSRNGCTVALTIAPQLSAAAYEHSRDMAINNLFSHKGSDGSTMISRIQQAGYSFRQLAENIAAAPSTPKAVVEMWMESSGHRANILNCSLQDIGVGYYDQPDDQANVRLDSGTLTGPFRYYWTQDFGSH